MTRMNDTAIAPAPAGAITRPQQAAPSRYQGEEEDDILIPRIHLYQGLPSEAEAFGEGFKAGDLIHTLTKEKLENKNFVPVFGYSEYIKFKEPRGSGIEYRTKDKSQVPPADLEWDRVNSKPPAATKVMNFVVLFEGTTEPVVLSFKRTSINAGRSLNTFEKMRASKGPGFYAAGAQDKQNSKGKYKIATVRPIGDPPEAMKAIAQSLYDSLGGAAGSVNVTTNIDDGEFDPDAEQ